MLMIAITYRVNNWRTINPVAGWRITTFTIRLQVTPLNLESGRALFAAPIFSPAAIYI